VYFLVGNDFTLLILSDVSVFAYIVPLHNTNSYSSCCAIHLLDSSTSPNLKHRKFYLNLAGMIPETINNIFFFFINISHCVFTGSFFLISQWVYVLEEMRTTNWSVDRSREISSHIFGLHSFSHVDEVLPAFTPVIRTLHLRYISHL
jgi:hypothetical protein